MTWARPPIPEFSLIEAMLGAEIHDAVFHGKTPRQALRDAENLIHSRLTAKSVT